MREHRKHTHLERPSLGEFARNELAILGTNCNRIKALARHITASLPAAYKVAYVDADHKNEGEAGAISEDKIFWLRYTDKIDFRTLNYKNDPNVFEKRAFFNDTDLVFINGNHFVGKAQIIVIDPAKSLEKKIDKLSNVQLILLAEGIRELPAYLRGLSFHDQVPVLNLQDQDKIAAWVEEWLQKATPAMNGLVLAGGESRRMGTDKGELSYYGTSQRQHVYGMLQEHCQEVFVSCNGTQVNHLEPGLKYILDSFLTLGPLGGILSAFQYNPNVAWLTVACDLPLLDANTLQLLVAGRQPSQMATAFMDSDNIFPEPLITIWEPKMYPVLLRFLSQGYSCPRKALINTDVALLQAPDATAFTNVNDPQEYQAALSTIKKDN